MDGAGPLQMLRHVTLPMLRPLLVTLVVVSTIWDFKIFDQVYVMTGGGPYLSTVLSVFTAWRDLLPLPLPLSPPPFRLPALLPLLVLLRLVAPLAALIPPGPVV